MILAIIPARAGSKGIPEKNSYLLCNKPLICYTIESVTKSKLDTFVISTNMPEVLIYKGARRRPDHLCKDDTPMIDVVDYHLRGLNQFVDIDTVMILQPTSPLRTAQDINNAIDLFNNSDSDSLYSGYYLKLKHKKKTYDKHIDKPHFQRNGAIFIAKRELIEQGKLWEDNVIEYVMPEARSIDIDTMEDMRMAECLIKGGVLNDT